MSDTIPATTVSFWQTLNRAVITLLGVQLLGGMMLAPHSTFFPIYVQERGYSAIVLANIAAANQVAGLIASLVGGALADWLGRKQTLILGSLGFGIASCVFLVNSAWGIALLWVAGGFLIGLYVLGSESYLMDVAAPQFLGLTSALFNWGYTLGGVLSSPLAGLLLERWDYGLLAAVLIASALLTSGWISFILPPSPLAQVARPGWRELFGYRPVAGRPLILLLAGLRFLPTLYYAMLLLLIPLLLNNNGASKTVIALYATASWSAASLAQLAVGYAADKWSVNGTTALTFAVSLGSMIVLALGSGQLWVIFAAGLVGIAAAWSLSTLLPPLVAQATAPAERGRTLGFIHLFWNLAMILGALLGGQLFSRSASLPFVAAITTNVIVWLLLFLFVRAVRHSSAAGSAGHE